MGVQSSDLYPRERLSLKDETLKYDPCNLAVIQSIIIVTIVYRHEHLPKYTYDFRRKMMEMRKLFQGCSGIICIKQCLSSLISTCLYIEIIAFLPLRPLLRV